MALQSYTLDLGAVKFATVDLASNVQSMRGRVLKKSKPHAMLAAPLTTHKISILLKFIFFSVLMHSFLQMSVWE